MKLLAIDGNSIVNRAFYGIRPLTTKEGFFTNGIYGFLTILGKLREEVSPDAVAVAFDLREPTFRHKMFDGYKAGRKGMPSELAMQMPVLKELLCAMGIRVLECPGYEADDILGTVSVRSANEGWECYISTGDRDSFQLVREGVTVLLAATKSGQPEVRRYDPERIFEEYGLSPLQLIDVKALQGDSSDNIPGVAGVGPKTAVELIKKYGSVKALYEGFEADADMRENLKLKLRNDRENALMSYELGKIITDVPVCSCMEDLSPAPVNEGELVRILTKLEFFKFIEKWGLSAAPSTDTATVEKQPDLPLYTADRAGEAAEKAKGAETGLILDGGTAYAVFSDGIYTLDGDSLDGVIENAGSVVTDSSKELFAYAAERGLELRVCFDCSLAAYLLNPSSSDYSFSRLSAEYGVSNGKEGAEGYATLLKLSEVLKEKIAENGQEYLLYEVEIPLARVLADMERIGFLIDADATRKYGEVLEKEIGRLRDEIYSAVGYEFNLNSPKQLAEALFVKLGLRSGKKTKNGYSTDAKVLEELRYESPVVENLLEYRQLAKLKSTYCDGLLKVVSSDGRIHSSFNQTETRTGRISSSEPNLQNIPVRRELGRELRRFFVASEGCVLCDADYSQIELRVLAHMSEDENMRSAFISGEDVHTMTAASVFGVPAQMVTPLMRTRAKAVNFGIVYGIGAYSLGRDLKISFGEAKSYIEGYMKTFPSVAKYMDDTVSKAKETGFCETMFGRRRYLPELSSSNAVTRGFGERVARNMPVQGTAADIIKIAMVRVYDRLKEEGMKSRLILQVHDELIVEAPENEKEKALEILVNEMENAAKLSVALTVDAHCGKTWYDTK